MSLLSVGLGTAAKGAGRGSGHLDLGTPLLRGQVSRPLAPQDLRHVPCLWKVKLRRFVFVVFSDYPKIQAEF